MSSRLIAPQPINNEERSLICEVRERLSDVLQPDGIPNDLDTDLNLLRWIRGYQRDANKIIEVFPVYVASRHAAGFDVPDFVEKFFEMPNIKPFLKFIASSRLNDYVWSDDCNGFLFIERGWSQPREFAKVMRCSDYMLHCFGYLELLQQLILRRERQQNTNKPVKFIVLFDLHDVNMAENLNPLSVHMKYWCLRSELWQNWYPESVQGIFLVNPPKIVSALWRVARFFMNDQNLKLLQIVRNKHDILHYFPSWFIPKEFGGEFLNTVMPGDESGASRRQKITSEDHLHSYTHYKRKGMKRPESIRKLIGPDVCYIHRIDVPSGHSTLLWDFSANCDVEFAVYEASVAPKKLIHPRFKLCANKMSEEGIMEGLNEGVYEFEFKNMSGYFTLKLDFCILSTF